MRCAGRGCGCRCTWTTRALRRTTTVLPGHRVLHDVALCIKRDAKWCRGAWLLRLLLLRRCITTTNAPLRRESLTVVAVDLLKRQRRCVAFRGWVHKRSRWRDGTLQARLRRDRLLPAWIHHRLRLRTFWLCFVHRCRCRCSCRRLCVGADGTRGSARWGRTLTALSHAQVGKCLGNRVIFVAVGRWWRGVNMRGGARCRPRR